MPIHVKARHLLASAVVTGIFAMPAYAQYSGPSEIGQTTVAEILQNPVDDQDVQIQGHILRQTARKKYIFSDDTGEIVAKIKERHFAGQPVDEKTKVEIIGEVDTSRKHPPKIKVDSVRMLE
ncbi:NirD/YgiW/YdeI family stress tolerance protein [Paenalcaligenes niemegkensis]|uniref:YgiW/YdeI family stress tolerance OB fold protein n=1 Tax=Paenalcaligenes niemegkensis TaxID=2895469 RepID=UPI001EE830D3|nr:NirD/YgiW/YdeI family stress tolerance protein [Paenalcaligenes niemegkensis]MCQ9616442.1 NirD/YgiW/YdeI family stress tolerance protein [Paenalcaligenes niemegkensis]